MGSYEETMASLSEMKSRFQSGFSSSDRLFLDKLHRLMFGSEITNTGCSDCYRDAYAIIYSTLKKNKEMPKTPNYILKGGAIIHPVGTSRFYTNPLPSDDIAEEFLSKFPNEINKFAQFPADWEERVAAYKARKESEAKAAANVTVDTLKATSADEDGIAELKKQLAEAEVMIENLRKENTELAKSEDALKAEKEELELQVETLNKLLAEKSESTASEDTEYEELNNLRMELETVKTELESANAENEKLKTDNRALKAANTRLKNNSTKGAE